MTAIYHVGPNGPGPCTGGTGTIRPRGCPFKSGFHGTLKECEDVYEKTHERFEDCKRELQEALETLEFDDQYDKDVKMFELFADIMMRDRQEAEEIRNTLASEHFNAATGRVELTEDEFKREYFRRCGFKGLNPFVTNATGQHDMFPELVRDEIVITSDSGETYNLDVTFEELNTSPTTFRDAFSTKGFYGAQQVSWIRLPLRTSNSEDVAPYIEDLQEHLDYTYDKLQGGYFKHKYEVTDRLAIAGLNADKVLNHFEYCKTRAGLSAPEFLEYIGMRPSVNEDGVMEASTPNGSLRIIAVNDNQLDIEMPTLTSSTYDRYVPILFKDSEKPSNVQWLHFSKNVEQLKGPKEKNLNFKPYDDYWYDEKHME